MISVSGSDLFLVGFLAFLEGILSIDNAFVLAMAARHLPRERQWQALTYGLVGAIVFRLGALALVSKLIQWQWVKFVGGGYLVLVALKHFVFPHHEDAAKPRVKAGFWRTVLVIELLDIAFAVDSILAAVALTQKLWIVFTGGMVGVVLMRFAAQGFIRLLTKFPSFETTAFLMILVIGIKVIVDGFHLPGLDFEQASNPGFIVFWSVMAACLLYGFHRRPRRS